MYRVVIVSLVVLLSMGTALSVQRQSWNNGDNGARANESTTPHSSWHDAKKFDCLPKDVLMDEVVSYGPRGKENITVKKKLQELKARCRNGKLLDARNKEIRFFRISCWGHPPPNYLQIAERERQELEKLKKTYNVVVMACNRMVS